MDDLRSTNGLCVCGCGHPAMYASGHVLRSQRADRDKILADDYTVSDCGYTTPCWLWEGAATPEGYGTVSFHGRTTGAHRVMYWQKIGPTPARYHLDHLCRVPLCINPDHLEPVPAAVNVQRGRSAKLTPETVRMIRASPEPGVVLARLLGVSHQAIYAVRNGQRWLSVKD